MKTCDKFMKPRGMVLASICALALAIGVPHDAAADVAWNASTDDLALTISFVVKGGDTGEPLVGFPVLVKLSEGLGGGFRYADLRADGADMAFALEDGTPLPHDVDTWNPNGDSFVWVRIPSLVNGLVFKLHYGGSPRTSSAQSVWAGYTGVWHMNESGDEAAATIADSSENGISGTGGANSVAMADGMFGGARGTRTTGNKQPIFSTPYNSALDVGTAFTISGWFRPAVSAPDWAYLFSRKSSDGSDGWGLQFRSPPYPYFYFDSGKVQAGWYSLVANEWSKFDAIYNMSNVYFYVNGQLSGSGTITTHEYANHGTLGLQVGGLSNGYGTFNGDMDEVRYSAGAKSAAWIAAEYATMHSPETFLSAEYEGDGFLPPKAFEKYVPLTVAGYAGSSTLANFPVLVRVSESAMPGFSYAEAGGRDGVCSTDSERRYLAFECDTWNPSGESLFWVSVPELSGTETELRLYFGRHSEVPVGVGGRENPGFVWSQAGYAGVLHMDVSSDNKVVDSCLGVTGNVYNAVSTMPGAVGLLGGAYVNPEWQTTAPRVELAAGDSGYGLIRAALTNAPACTFSLWVKNDGGTGNGTKANYGYLFHHNRNDENGHHRFEICLEGNPRYMCIRDVGGELKNYCTDLSSGWHLVTLCYEGATRHIYFDGNVNSGFTSDASGYDPDPSKKLVIGCNAGTVDCQWVGGIDEVRFRAAATSTDWMAAEVANVNNLSFVVPGRVRNSTPPGFVITVH